MSRQLAELDGWSKWKPNPRLQEQKLSNTESDWKLAGTSSLCLSRTRGKKRKSVLSETTANNVEPRQLTTTSDLPATTSEDPSPACCSGAGDETTTIVEDNNNPACRAIFEVQAVRSLLETFIKECPSCGSPVEITFPNCCVATGIRVSCTNHPDCLWIENRMPATANVPLLPNSGSPLIQRTSDYAVNVLFLIAFLASGDGGTEAQRLLGFLGLPNATTMEKRSWPELERRLSPTIHEVAVEVLRKNLEDEVLEIFGDETNEEGDLLFELWKAKLLPEELWPAIDCSTDMGWQGRSSGKSYTSLSGHAALVGGRTRKPVMIDIKAKACSLCKGFYRKNPITEEPPQHPCIRNHDGTSGSMEPKSILDMLVKLHKEHHCKLDRIVSDDDSSIKAKLKWRNDIQQQKTYEKTGEYKTPTIINSNGNVVPRPDHGALPAEMDEPGFLADPNHRKKTLKGELYRLVSRRVAERCTMTRCDCVRLSTNFAYMVRTLHNKPVEDYAKCGKAVLEHHFDNHEFCGPWCRRKDQTEDERKASERYYRSKTKDAKLYSLLQEKIARFVSEDALLEVGHGMDTLVNESLNNTIAWLAPKNKVYSTTLSLRNRIDVAISINALGYKQFFEILFDRLGIDLPKESLHYFEVVSRGRDRRIAKAKEPATKKRRQRKFHDRLDEHTKLAKKERCKREGLVYQTGIGMNGGYLETDDDDGGSSDNKKKRCNTCGGTDHLRKTNKLCPYYLPPARQRQQQGKKEKTQGSNSNADDTADDDIKQTERDADELDLLDQLAFDGDNDKTFDYIDGQEAIEDAEDDPYTPGLTLAQLSYEDEDGDNDTSCIL